jgi:putative transposase
MRGLTDDLGCRMLQILTANPEVAVKAFLQPWQLLLLVLAGWVNRLQQDVIEYLLAENRVLRQKVGKRRILVNDQQRRRLAVKGMILGRKVREQIAAIVTPETILRWHRELVAQSWDYSKRRKKAGRPVVSQEIVALVLRLAKENRSWGYNRIQGAVRNLGCVISDTAVANILKAHGIETVPERKRKSSWKEFLNAHWDDLASVDFTTIGVWTKQGLVTYYLLFFMEVATRRVHISQVSARTLTKTGCSRLPGMSPMPDKDFCLARNTC